MAKKLDILNQRFSFLVAIEYIKKEYKWLCRCDCGNTTLQRTTSLTKGLVKSCGCKTLELSNAKKVLPDNMAAVNSIYRAYKLSAFRRGFQFSLSIEDLLYFIYKDCFYCGGAPIPTTLTLNSSARCKPKEISYNGIDRIHNNIGYVKDNCITCCKICNRAKSNMPYEDFLFWLDRIVSFRGAKNVAA